MGNSALKAMRYILVDEQRRNNAIEELKSIDISRPIEVTIKPHKKNRSNSQNNLMWMWYPYLAEHFGYTPDELHEELKVKFLGVTEKLVCGELIRKPVSTAGLKIDKMAEYLTKIEVLARAENINLPYPDDYKYAIYGGK